MSDPTPADLAPLSVTMKFAHESAVTRIALESFGVSVLKIRPPMPFDDADGDLLVDVLDSALNDLPR